MNYAIIKNGIVTNTIVLDPNDIPDCFNAISLGDVPVEIGDTFEDGIFYRNGKRILTMVERLRKEVEELDSELMNITYENIIGGLE